MDLNFIADITLFTSLLICLLFTICTFIYFLQYFHCSLIFFSSSKFSTWTLVSIYECWEFVQFSACLWALLASVEIRYTDNDFHDVNWQLRMMIAMRWKFYYIRKTCTEGEKSRKNDFSDLYIYGSSSRARRELFPSITSQTARSNPSNRSVNELFCSQRAKITALWYFYLHTQRNTNEHIAELFDFFLSFFITNKKISLGWQKK